MDTLSADIQTDDPDFLRHKEAFAFHYPFEKAAMSGVERGIWEKTIEGLAKRAVADKFRYGYRNSVWKLAETQIKELRAQFPKGVIYLVVMGGHRSAKTEWAGYYVTRDMVLRDKRRWWCGDDTESASRDNQQPYIEKYLPNEWRPDETGVLDKRRQKITKVRYTVSGGFTENVLVLPNKSECRFKFYQGQKVSALQSVALDGFWGDELLPYEWISEIEWRLVERNGLFVLTFTPYEGWTQTVGHFLEGAKVIEQVPADPELLPLLTKRSRTNGEVSAEIVHRVLQCADPRARVIYFHPSDNPVFGNWEGIKEKSKHLGREEILKRVYGMVTRTAYVQFPLFSENVHVLSGKDWEYLKRKHDEAERYHLVDPCSGRLWFMIWVWATEEFSVIYREWPSYGHPSAYIQGIGMLGPWAVPGEAADGSPGPAQKSNFGFGLERFVEEIERAEGDEEILERWIDSRYSNTPRMEREGTITLIEEMLELGMEFRAMVSEDKILNRRENDGSIEFINSALYYDKDVAVGRYSKQLGRVNKPKLYVRDTCPNCIYALKNWTGKDGQKGACKDPIDVIRGMFLSQVGYRGDQYYVWQQR